MIKRALQASGRFAPLVRAGLIAGIVVAAVSFPIAAISGMGAKASADLFESLPRELHVLPPAQTTYVYANDGKTLITTFYEEHRKYTPIAQMSPYIQQAIVASEDARFYEHHGVDVKGIVRAFVANQEAGSVSQGASTLTMQYVRNALRDSAATPQEVQAATERTPARKIREMRLAVQVEREMTKEQILEKYLNVAYFGHRAYGIYAASEVYFSKKPADLTLDEAAMLAGVVQAPSEYDPAKGDKAAALERRNYVIDRMADLEYISRPAAETSKKAPIALKLTDPPNDCVGVNKARNDWGFFCDAFKAWWLNQPAFGASPGEREDKLRRGGYTVVTSIDPKTQKAAMQNTLEKEPIGSKMALGTVIVQPGTGLIKAMSVNRTYSLDQKNNGPNPDYNKASDNIPSNYPNTVNMLLGGGDLPGYQAGSTFKFFTMMAALDKGIPLTQSFYSPQRLQSQYWTGWDDPKACGGGHWCPQNASASMTGVQNMWTGWGKSVNTYFVQLEQKVGAEAAVRMAEKLGLHWRTDIDRLQASREKANTWGAFTLGVADAMPLEMAAAYATAAADGMYCEPIPVMSITGPDGQPATSKDAKGNLVPIAQPRCSAAVKPEVARAAIDAMRCTTGYGAAKASCGGWSTAPGVYGSTGRPIAGKTGTTDDTRSAWFVGVTPELAGASFIADPDCTCDLAGDWNSWKPIDMVSGTIRDALAGKPIRYFTPPSGSLLRSSLAPAVPRSATTTANTPKPKPR